MEKLVSKRFLLRRVIPSAFVICAFLLWFCLRKPWTAQEIIAAAVRDVNCEESWGRRFHAAVWKGLPAMITDMLPAGSGPKDIGRVRMNALEELGGLAPQSDLVVTTLLEVLGDQRRSLGEHLSAIGALGRIGPFAKSAVDPFLSIIAASTNTTNSFAQERQPACFQALSTIAPADERVLNTVFEQIERRTDGFSSTAFSAISFLELNAAVYDEKVQARLVNLMRTDYLEPSLVRVVGMIQPDSARTASILVEFLREGDQGTQAVVVNHLNNRPIRRAEIMRGLNNLLAELQAETPPNAPAFTSAPSPQNYKRQWNELRRNTTSALGRMGPMASESVSLLRADISHPDPAVRSTSAIAFFRITDDFSAADELYGELLGDKALEVRKLAVLDLAQISAECPASVPHLIRASEDQAFKVRQNAIIGLAAAGTNAVAALPRLTSLLSDRSPAIRYDAKNAIEKIRGGLR